MLDTKLTESQDHKRLNQDLIKNKTVVKIIRGLKKWEKLTCQYCHHDTQTNFGFEVYQAAPRDYEKMMERGLIRDQYEFYACQPYETCCKFHNIRTDALNFKLSKNQKKAEKKWMEFLNGKRSISGVEQKNPKKKKIKILPKVDKSKLKAVSGLLKPCFEDLKSLVFGRFKDQGDDEIEALGIDWDWEALVFDDFSSPGGFFSIILVRLFTKMVEIQEAHQNLKETETPQSQEERKDRGPNIDDEGTESKTKTAKKSIARAKRKKLMKKKMMKFCHENKEKILKILLKSGGFDPELWEIEVGAKLRLSFKPKDPTGLETLSVIGNASEKTVNEKSINQKQEEELSQTEIKTSKKTNSCQEEDNTEKKAKPFYDPDHEYRPPVYDPQWDVNLIKKRKFEIRYKPSSFTWEKYDVYNRYNMSVHAKKMHTVRFFNSFIVESPMIKMDYPDLGYDHSSEAEGKNLESAYPQKDYLGPAPDRPNKVGSYHLELYLDDKLIGVSVQDHLPEGILSAYFFYEPVFKPLCLGIVSTLIEISEIQQMFKTMPTCRYYYMGTYIHNNSKLRYKSNYLPMEVCCPVTQAWVNYDKKTEERLRNEVVRISGEEESLDQENEFFDDLLGYMAQFKSGVVPYVPVDGFGDDFRGRIQDGVGDRFEFNGMVYRTFFEEEEIFNCLPIIARYLFKYIGLGFAQGFRLIL